MAKTSLKGGLYREAANVNDKDLVEPLMRMASSLLRRHGKCISHVIADTQHYSAEVFRTIRGFGAEPIIPPTQGERSVDQPTRDQTLQG